MRRNCFIVLIMVHYSLNLNFVESISSIAVILEQQYIMTAIIVIKFQAGEKLDTESKFKENQLSLILIRQIIYTLQLGEICQST